MFSMLDNHSLNIIQMFRANPPYIQLVLPKGILDLHFGEWEPKGRKSLYL